MRIFFEKTGRLKYISHLDLNRFLLRVIRISKLPIWYTQGYHPRPYIVIAAPLSLGFESEYEAVDIRINEDISYDEIKLRLSAVLPEGLKIIKVASPVYKVKDIMYSDYEIKGEFDSDVLDALKSDELIIDKAGKKGKIKSVDVRQKIKSYNLDGDTLSVTLFASNDGGLNPNLLIEALEKKLNRQIEIKSVKRKMLYVENSQKFE
ncbi:MAG: TIGR03936 family radical SAM-associated protein [Acutalibacteraceae bacterium]|nr:TIGR03936 family radical SAM-associated protein [Acutalibacteraceae bacterium]